MSILRASLAFTFCLLSAACSQVVTVSHSGKHSFDSETSAHNEGAISGIPTKILVQPQAAVNQKREVESGLLIAGPVNSWEVNIHEALPDSVRDATLNTYSDIEIGQKCDDCGLIFRPKVKQINIEKISMQATVEVEMGIFTAYGQEIKRVEAAGKSPFMDATRLSTGVAGYFVPLLGTALGNFVVSKTVQQALDKAMTDLGQQISEEANTGILARTWLPKRENRDYDIGNHQYTAEQVAKAVGCNVNNDEIRLVAKQYFEETYAAMCWGKPEFTIDCGYGRCALGDDFRGLAQQ